MSPFLTLSCGVQQGCPLSGLLFVVGIELLNLAILANDNVKGIKIADEEVKITLYADDTALFLRDLTSVNSLLEILHKFKNCSGLELNKTKTEAMWLGSWADCSDTLFGFRWPKDSIQALGIYFSYNQDVSDRLNFESKLKDLQNILNSWKRRKLTLLGKINMNTLGLSKLVFNASVLSLPDGFTKKVDAITFDFLWDGKPHKISKSTIIGKEEDGVLRMIAFLFMNKALKSTWAARFLDEKQAPWKIIPNFWTAHLGGFTFLLSCNYKSKELPFGELPFFYILQYWEEMKHITVTKDTPTFNEVIIWNNSNIKVHGKTVNYLSAPLHKNMK